MQRCPYCAKPNQPSSTFCLYCGEPIDEESVREFAPVPVFARSSPTQQADSSVPAASRPLLVGAKSLFQHLFSAERAVEFAMGAAILVGVVGFAVYLAMQQAAQTEHYQLGIQAEAAHDYDRALTEYAADSGYRDTPQRQTAIQSKLALRNMFYNTGLQERNSHKWWQASVSLEKAAEITPNYKDLSQQLADVRRVNGRIFYKQSGATAGGQTAGLFAAWADGSEPQLLPDSAAASTMLAVSPDGYWVVYTTDTDSTSSRAGVLLYNVRNDVLYPLLAPEIAPTYRTAQFQGNRLILTVYTRLYSYMLPASGSPAKTLTPDFANGLPDSTRPALYLVPAAGSVTGTTKLSILVQGATGTTLLPLSTEDGVVDGALFNAGGSYLLFRVCGYPDADHNYYCSLKLVDLTSQLRHPYTIDTIPLRLSDRARFDLRGEFTRDGGHILLVETYQGEREEHLYEIATGDTWGPDLAASDRLARALSAGPLLQRTAPGLALWQGANKLSSPADSATTSNGQTQASSYIVEEHYVRTTPNDMYMLYLTLGANSGSPSYNLYAASFRAQTASSTSAPRPLINSLQAPETWLPSLYLLPEGGTLLSTQPPTQTASPGLYAYDLQAGATTLLATGATALYPPGYASVR